MIFHILTDESDANSKYKDVSDYIKNNLELLKNHDIGNIDYPELSEYILDFYQSHIENKIRYHVEKLYYYIFQFICLPDIQNYFLKLNISCEISYIENYIKMKRLKSLLKISQEYINNQIRYYKSAFGIEKFVDISTADILVDNI